MRDRGKVVAMTRWDARSVGGCGRSGDGVDIDERGSTAYDGMGLSRPSDCVCRCSFTSLGSEHKKVMLEE